MNETQRQARELANGVYCRRDEALMQINACRKCGYTMAHTPLPRVILFTATCPACFTVQKLFVEQQPQRYVYSINVMLGGAFGALWSLS